MNLGLLERRRSHSLFYIKHPASPTNEMNRIPPIFLGRKKDLFQNPQAEYVGRRATGMTSIKLGTKLKLSRLESNVLLSLVGSSVSSKGIKPFY